jgi:hypothetical protein
LRRRSVGEKVYRAAPPSIPPEARAGPQAGTAARMVGLSARYDPSAVEASSRALWKTREIPAVPGSLGPPSGPVTRQFLWPPGAGESPLDWLARIVSADVAARFLAGNGRRAIGMVPRREEAATTDATTEHGQAEAVAAWTAGGSPTGFGTPEGASRRQRMIEALTHSGLLDVREFPFRSCPVCETPRTPATIVYQSERGPAYLVRFLVRDAVPSTSLLVWTDNPWKLLGTTAVLVSPDLTYVTAVYRRRGVVERIVLSKSALPRLRSWLPGCELEILEERPGGELSGTPFVHPLVTECPPLSRLEPPTGTVLASSDVGESGTGIVGLVPRHGAADSQAAATLRVEGPVVVTPRGRIPEEPRHKYSGLPMDAADAFVLRDLRESGLIFAELTVQRGVPHCGICGSGLIWLPGRAWCLEMARLPGPVEREFSRLLPTDALPPPRDVVPWPLSAISPTDDPSAPILLECAGCDRLHVPGFTGACECGRPDPQPVRRELLPAFSETLSQWAEVGPGEAVELFVPDRRRVPAVLHHLVAREASGVRAGELRLIRLPTMVSDSDAELLGEGGCADALRAALVRATAAGRRPSHFSDRYRHEARRLRKVWQLARTVLEIMRSDGVRVDIDFPVAHLDELPDEDRAFLSRFERVRNEVRAHFEVLELGAALERLAHFMEQDVGTGYLPLARARLDPTSAVAARASTCQVLARVVYLWIELFAPIAPFTAEVLAQAFRPDSPSLFERPLTPVEDALVDSAREQEFDRWVEFAEALRSARRQVGLPADAILPRVVLLVAEEPLANELQRVAPVLSRVGRTGQIEIDSPNRAWAGRRIEARPIPAEIQRVYGGRTGRILHLLERLPGRKAMEGMRAGTLNVVLDGETVRILPGMLEFLESLPECVVPVPWRDGEILLIDPTESATGSLPSLSLDGLGVVRHVARRLRKAALPSPPERILAAASGALAGELQHHAVAIAAHLGCARFQLAGDEVRFPLSERSTGRTRRGDRWAIWIPGAPVSPPRQKRPRARPRGARIRQPEIAEVAIDPAADEAERLRGGGIEELTDRLAEDLGRSLVGPTKMAAAWDAGFQTVESFRGAPFDRLAAVPGFGPYVAAEVVRRYGGSAPPRIPRLAPLRPLRRRSAPTRPATAPSSRPALPEPSPAPPPARVLPEPAPSPPSLPPEELAAAPEPVLRAPRAPPRAQPPKLEVLSGPQRPIGAPVVTPLGPFAGPQVTPVSPLPPLAPPSVPPGPVPGAPIEAPAPPRRTEPLVPSPFEPRPVPIAPPPPPAPKGIEIWKGPDAESAWTSFLEITANGDRGVCITREPPGARRASLGQRIVQVVWLSNIPLGPANPTARPGDLDGLEFGIETELKGRDAKAIFLESLEYLVTIHGLARITAFLTKLDAAAREQGARIMVPLRTGLMDPNDLQSIAGNFRGRPDSSGTDAPS